MDEVELMKIKTTKDTIELIFSDEPICEICNEFMEGVEYFDPEDIGIKLQYGDYYCQCCGTVAKPGYAQCHKSKLNAPPPVV
jgi:hypothetical protein